MRRIAIAGLLVLLIAIATPAVSAGPDLIVDRIDPKYIFEDLENSLFVNVSNIGDAASGTYNVSIQITNDMGTVRYSHKTSNCASLAAGESTLDTKGLDVSLGSWTPSTLENITLTVTADCDGDVTEDDEGNNASIEYRNTTGDCDVDTMLPKSCYGYRGQNPMTTQYTGKGKVIYTVGDYKYKNDTVNFNIGSGGDTNQVDGETADIPDGATVKSAKLYVYFTWRNVASSPNPGTDPRPDFEISIDGGSQLMDEAYYTDMKGFAGSNSQYGTLVYDVTANVTGDGTYEAVRSSYAASKGYVSGMALMVVHSCSKYNYTIAHGYDRLATLYWGSDRWQYYVSPDDATTTITLDDPGTVAEADLLTVTVDANAATESMQVNSGAWTVGAWTGSYYYPLGFDRSDVTSDLTGAGSDEVAKFQERSTSSNGFSPLFVCMQTSKTGSECLGSCYDNDTCSANLIGTDMNCSACTNAGYYWHPNKDSDCFADQTPWDMCMDWCPECCDSVDNDADGGTDYPADGQCTCGLDPSETDPACPVPELATFTLVGIGLMMFAGVMYRRKE